MTRLTTDHDIIDGSEWQYGRDPCDATVRFRRLHLEPEDRWEIVEDPDAPIAAGEQLTGCRRCAECGDVWAASCMVAIEFDGGYLCKECDDE